MEDSVVDFTEEVVEAEEGMEVDEKVGVGAEVVEEVVEDLEREGCVEMELAREGVLFGAGERGEGGESVEELLLRFRLLRLGVGDACEPQVSVTVLMPRLVVVLAGITKVTRWS